MVQRIPLLNVPGWVAAAADAQRHLTTTLALECRGKLTQLYGVPLQVPDVCAPDRTFSDNSSNIVPLLSYSHSGKRTVLCRSGKLLGHLNSSFVAEAVALEWCLDLFMDSYA